MKTYLLLLFFLVNNLVVSASCVSFNDDFCSSADEPVEEWFQKGKQAFIQKDFTLAIFNFKSAILHDHNLTSAYYLLAESFVETDECYKAICVYLELLSLEPSKQDVYYGMAKAKLKIGDKESALSDVQKAIDISPDSIKFHVLKGHIFDSKKQYSLAANQYLKAIDLTPENGMLYFLVGQALFEQGEFSEALKYFNKSLKHNYASVDLWKRIGRVNELYGNYSDALVAYNVVLRLDSTSSENFDLRGNLYFQNEQYNQALADFSKSILLNPKNPFAFFNRAYTRFYLNDIEHSMADIDSAIATHSQAYSGFYDLRAKLHTLKLEWENVVEDCSTSIQIFPSDGDVYLNRAKGYFELGIYDKAILDLDVAIDFGLTEAHELKANILLLLQE